MNSEAKESFESLVGERIGMFCMKILKIDVKIKEFFGFEEKHGKKEAGIEFAFYEINFWIFEFTLFN